MKRATERRPDRPHSLPKAFYYEALVVAILTSAALWAYYQGGPRLFRTAAVLTVVATMAVVLRRQLGRLLLRAKPAFEHLRRQYGLRTVIAYSMLAVYGLSWLLNPRAWGAPVNVPVVVLGVLLPTLLGAVGAFALARGVHSRPVAFRTAAEFALIVGGVLGTMYVLHCGVLKELVQGELALLWLAGPPICVGLLSFWLALGARSTLMAVFLGMIVMPFCALVFTAFASEIIADLAPSGSLAVFLFFPVHLLASLAAGVAAIYAANRLAWNRLEPETSRTSVWAHFVQPLLTLLVVGSLALLMACPTGDSLVAWVVGAVRRVRAW